MFIVTCFELLAAPEEGGLRTEPGLCQKVSSGQSRAEAQEQGSVNKNTANETLAQGAERAQFYFVFTH